jgi:hypothetical protein
MFEKAFLIPSAVAAYMEESSCRYVRKKLSIWCVCARGYVIAMDTRIHELFSTACRRQAEFCLAHGKQIQTAGLDMVYASMPSSSLKFSAGKNQRITSSTDAANDVSILGQARLIIHLRRILVGNLFF